MATRKVKVQIKPFCNIGGFGNAGDVVWMSAKDARLYKDQGLITILKKDEPASTPVPSQVADK